MTLNEFPQHIQALKDEARALWGAETKEQWACPKYTEGNLVYDCHYPQDTKKSNYCPNHGEIIKKVTTETHPTYLYILNDMIEADDPVAFYKSKLPKQK